MRGALRASLVAQPKESACNAGEAGDKGSIPGSGRPPLDKEMAPHSSILA